MKLLFTFLFVTFIPAMLSAQDQVEMADAMRSNGKIYAVVAIILLIFFGLIIYLVMIDRKVSKIEKQVTGDQ